MSILILNAGSSTLKFSLFDDFVGDPRASGIVTLQGDLPTAQSVGTDNDPGCSSIAADSLACRVSHRISVRSSKLLVPETSARI